MERDNSHAIYHICQYQFYGPLNMLGQWIAYWISFLECTMSFLRGTTFHILLPKESHYFIVSVFYMSSLARKQKWFIYFKPFRAINPQTFSNFPSLWRLLFCPTSAVLRVVTPSLCFPGTVTKMRPTLKSPSTQISLHVISTCPLKCTWLMSNIYLNIGWLFYQHSEYLLSHPKYHIHCHVQR